jgi:hypothetical protein
MKTLSWKTLLMILALASLTACGGDGYNSDDDDDDDVTNEQFPQEENVNEFSTRLTPTLLIAGKRCEGTETTTDATGTNVTCAKDKWLVTLDDANTCTPQGLCTEIGVVPFVAELDRSDRIELPRFTYFQIDPLSAVTPTQEDKIDDFLVKFDLQDENAEVVPK